jgi:hypothetical protein
MSGFIQSVFDRAVAEYHPDHRRIVLKDVPGFGDIPFGPKIQNPGPRCRRWKHRWMIDVYPGVRCEYRDRVCTVCDRRKRLTRTPLN